MMQISTYAILVHLAATPYVDGAMTQAEFHGRAWKAANDKGLCRTAIAAINAAA